MILKSHSLILSFLLNALVLYIPAQTGPGGIGSSGSNVLWLKADQGVYNNAGTTLASNSDNVQQWNDQSGNARNALQATLANRPNYFTNRINGFPTLSFVAANADLMISAAVTTANLASVWAVASYSTLPSSNPGILIGSPSGSGNNVAAGDKCIGMWVSSANNNVWGRGVQSNATTRDISQTTALAASTFYIVNNIYRSAAIHQYVNGASAGNNTLFNGTLRSWTDITVGRQGNESWNGDISEIVIFNTELNAAQRRIVDNYLAAKYGRTLTSGDYYDEDNAVNGNFDFEVAGIGRVNNLNQHTDAQGTGIVRILNPSNLGDNEFLIWGHNNLALNANETSDVPAGVQARFNRVWRVSEVDTTGGAVDVGSLEIRWDLNGLGTVTAAQLRLLVDTDNDGIFSDETAISGANALGGGIYQFTGVTALANNRRFTLGTTNSSQTPLPIELLYLRAEEKETGNLIEWGTAREIDVKQFEIERSTDCLSWTVLQTIKPRGGSQKADYSVLDPSPGATFNYYRLVETDNNGARTTYSTVMTDNSVNTALFSLWPNPAGNVVFVSGPGLIRENLSITDLEGKKCSTGMTEISPECIRISLEHLQAGIYLVRSGTENKKLIVLKEKSP